MSATAASTDTARTPASGGVVMHFICEKKSPFTASWTMRRCAFNCETRYLYYSSKALNFSSPWKKVFKITGVHVPAEAETFDAKQLFTRDMNSDGDRSGRNLYLFNVEGVYRNIMAHDDSPPIHALPNALGFQRSNRGWPSKHSPRGDNFQREKTIVCTLRCDNADLLHRLVDTMRDVLADDGLCPPVHEGLPPYDPRNGLPLAHVPLYLCKPFRGLERCVFYAFERGDLIGQSPGGQVGTALTGGFLCITDQMVLVLRADGAVPRWISLRSIATVEYNTRHAKLPFLALLTTARDVPDIVFVPSPPLLTSEERHAYNGAKSVERVVRILQRLSADIQIGAEKDCVSVRTYVESSGTTARPLRFNPGKGFNDVLVPPLPKAHLAKMLASQQRETRQRRASATHVGGDHPKSTRDTDHPRLSIIDVGEVGMRAPRAAGYIPAPPAQAVRTCAPPRSVPAPSQDEVVLDSLSSTADDDSDDSDDVADPDICIGRGEGAPQTECMEGSGVGAHPHSHQQRAVEAGSEIDDIDLSDSLDDLTMCGPVEAGDAGGKSKDPETTLDELIKQGLAVPPM